MVMGLSSAVFDSAKNISDQTWMHLRSALELVILHGKLAILLEHSEGLLEPHIS
jgi:hypothetical protein